MARFDNFRSSLQGITVTDINKTLLGLQGALVAGIFVFFNTTYSFFGNNFAAWGKYLIFPAFMATEVLMAGIATYWHRNARYKIMKDKKLSDEQKDKKLLLIDLRLASTWIKTGLILMSGLAGLGVIPGALAFSAPLMMAGLALYALVALAIDISEIRTNAQANMFNEGQQKAFPRYKEQIYQKRNELIGSVLLFTVVACVGVANYIPDLIVVIPGLSPLSVFIGILAGAATIALAYNTPPEIKADGPTELKISATKTVGKLYTETVEKPTSANNDKYYYKPGENIDPKMVALRRGANATSTTKPAIVKPAPAPATSRYSEAEIKDMEPIKKQLFGITT